jgi:hypothetical protein
VWANNPRVTNLNQSKPVYPELVEGLFLGLAV